MAHIDNKKVDFVQRENESDCRTFRTGSIGEKEQHTSRFRRLTSGSLRHKSSCSQVPSIKTDFIEPVHNMDPLHTYFNSDTEVSDSGVPRINDNSYINNTRRPKRYRRSCRSPYETPNYSTALGPLREKHKLSPLERIFLEAAERGDKSTLIRCLSFSNGVNVNCVNMLGRTAIQIAVDNENIELVELLLEQPGIEIGDAILYAIQEGVYRIVEMLIDHPSITKEMLGTSWTTQCIGIGKREEESHDFSADISPVMLAAICNQFEILQLLINRGARIEEPHKSSCSCEHCHRLLTDDPLKHTLQRINTYKALASPAWISLTSPDPILTAFELSSELLHLASRENEFKETFLSLCEQCRKYACDLLDLCRGTGEVVAVLSKGTDSDESLSDVSNRLKLAIKHEQKKFVAHPHCQHLLTTLWYDQLPGWRKRHPFTKLFLCFCFIIALPILAPTYLIHPHGCVGQLMRSPLIKFINHSASFAIFIFLLLIASTDTLTKTDLQRRSEIRGPDPNVIEMLILWWVIGFVWSEMKQIWEEGLKAYVRQWWNWLDFLMLGLYLTTVALRVVAVILRKTNQYGTEPLPRNQWPETDPTLLSEALFSIAHIFSFARIIFLFQTCQFISYIILALIWKQSIGKFVTFVNKTSGERERMESARNTMVVGEILLLIYHAMAIIVLVNMLIAMMSNSFQTIQNHADTEWKFARSKLWAVILMKDQRFHHR
ncbi:LOW QUALITY PROTEIN: putative transient receptor potential channel [Schistosoma mansoni]|uniref:putative transient receptor potential channel n=1 Tax=Schistosoma mansoni TaxID=6183 RepID=UPI00022DC482|nr:LOW QUALITY PROTEIN: putative transient receptor potential channel [Schistosoma mansoni]|eukprot:XP_018649047.1 LOW QUALITY PROTEIN: putative transient receptor potential channel [Schistosoma mansoni]